jgi:valyl-tRNA synthetase
MNLTMEKNYDPAKIEAKWYAEWLERRVFHGESGRGGTPYCIMIPPPNVTGILHMGHALNNTIQDILIRWHRMQGMNTVWMPGTDHAGIATQNVVEKALRKEGLSREKLGREAFVERVWQWKHEYGSTIINQLKTLGSACDWERERFTMDEGLSRAVAEVFVRLYNKGLIYRGKRIINWCPRCRTALSDEESEHQDSAGKMYHIRYPLAAPAPGEPAWLVVATTRPETMLGDVAVAVSPRDGRYQAWVGRMLNLPILNRAIPVIADDYVDPKFGTGAVKVTPAHDPNDYEIGLRHNLTPINVMTDAAHMNEEAGPYAGLDRFECRKKLVADLEAAGLMEKIEDHQNAVGHCYRCDTVVEPRLSPQWFVKMKPLAEPAIAVVRDEQIKFVPARWTKVYLDWMENIRDWCISRQIWWGHRIPVYYCDGCGKEWAAVSAPGACPACGGKQFRQDPDVLDTWFSSWLWPFSTFGWPDTNADLKFYYPTNTLVTASEIIFFWVARMIMAGMEFMGDIPFREVYIHGTVRDDKGRKMSKSLGNSIDPRDIIREFSADALRFSLTMLTATGQDVYISKDKFELGRNFGTKIWNAARFMQMHTPEAPHGTFGAQLPAIQAALLSPDDRHLVTRLQDAIREVDDNLGKCRFNDAAHALYDFFWHQFCDWYLEYAKDILYGKDSPRRQQTVRLMHYVFASGLKLLHPFMPFLTEELWHAMGYGDAKELLMTVAWPKLMDDALLKEWGVNAGIAAYVEDKHELIRAGRTLRADYDIAPSEKISYIIKPATPEGEALLKADQPMLKALLRAEQVDVDAAFVSRGPVPSLVVKLAAIYMPIEGHVDVAAEIKKLTGQVEKLDQELARVLAKLGNPDFMNRAKPEAVEQQRVKEREQLENKERLNRMLETLRGLQKG